MFYYLLVHIKVELGILCEVHLYLQTMFLVRLTLHVLVLRLQTSLLFGLTERFRLSSCQVLIHVLKMDQYQCLPFYHSNIIHPALKEWKRKFKRVKISVKMIFCIHLKWLIKGERHLERASALRNLLQYD